MTTSADMPGSILMRSVDVGALRWWVNPSYTKHCQIDMTSEQKVVFERVTARLTELNLELAGLTEDLNDVGLFVRVSLESELSDHTLF